MYSVLGPSEFHSVSFDCIHLLQLLTDPSPLPCPPTQLCVLFVIFYPSSPACAAHTFLNVWSSTGAWPTPGGNTLKEN